MPESVQAAASKQHRHIATLVPGTLVPGIVSEIILITSWKPLPQRPLQVVKRLFSEWVPGADSERLAS